MMVKIQKARPSDASELMCLIETLLRLEEKLDPNYSTSKGFQRKYKKYLEKNGQGPKESVSNG